jgi:hypothetical protein
LVRYNNIFNKNIVIGEDHTHDAPIKWLLANARHLAAKGYKYCFIEGIPKGKVWKKGTKIKDVYHERYSYNDTTQLYDTLTRHGIKVIGMDVWQDNPNQTDEEFERKKKENFARLRKDPNWRLGHNKIMIETIDKYSNNGKEKYIALCGRAHVFNKKFIKKYIDTRFSLDDHIGLGELPNAVSVFPHDKTNSNDITLRCGYNYHNYKLYSNDDGVTIKIGHNATVSDIKKLYKEAYKLKNGSEAIDKKDAKKNKKHRKELDNLCNDNIKKLRGVIKKVKEEMEKQYHIAFSQKEVKDIFTHYGRDKSKVPTGSRRFSSLFRKQCKEDGLLFSDGDNTHSIKTALVIPFLQKNGTDAKAVIGI